MRDLRAVVAVLLALPSMGCGVLTQAVLGWSTEETKKTQKTHSIQVVSSPPGAQIVRQGIGEDQNIGVAPLYDNVPYEQEQRVEEAGWLPMLIVGSVELIVGMGMALAVDTGTDSFGEPTFDESGDSDPILIAGGLLLIAGLVDVIWGGLRSADSTTILETKAVGPTAVKYVATKDGLPTATFAANVPDTAMANLVLDPNYVATNAPPPPTPASPPPPPAAAPPPVAPPPPPVTSGGPTTASAKTKSWIIAVMEVEDLNAKSRRRRVDKDLVRNLGDQLRIFIAQTGVRTIDKSSQDRALKEQLAEIKKDSYKQCYDDSCQIELGKALAASHILRSRITKFGRKCVLNGELIDLKAEVTVKAASAQGACEAEGFLTMCERVAQDLVR